MAQHTPGPWAWSAAYETCDGRETWSLVGKDGYGILSCDGTANAPQGLGDEANAHLIAAAPEMLEALKEVDDLQQAHFGDGLMTHLKLIKFAEKARAVIAKAEGR